jgi:hypothetical protein
MKETSSRLLEFFDLADDVTEVGPITGIEFGMEQFAISANFKSASTRRDERERFDAFAEFKNFGRQTDGLRRVVSNHAVFDRDVSLHPACSFPKKMVRGWTEPVKGGKTEALKGMRPARSVLGKLDKPPPTRHGAPLWPNTKR